jgi:SAM-dependent methyltransferase
MGPEDGPHEDRRAAAPHPGLDEARARRAMPARKSPCKTAGPCRRTSRQPGTAIRRLPGGRPAAHRRGALRPGHPDRSRSRPAEHAEGQAGCSSWAAAASSASIAMAKAGATAIGVDFSTEQLAFARRLGDRENVRVELRLGDLAHLSLLPGDSVDMVFSSYAFGYVEDLKRVFRWVHRVLTRGAMLVFSLPPPRLRHDRRRPPARTAAHPPVLVRPRAPRVRVERGGLHRLPPHHRRPGHRPGAHRVPDRHHPRAPRSPSGLRSMFWRETFQYVPAP